MKKERLDLLLVQKNLFASREQAKRAILAGLVQVNRETIVKAGTKVDVNATLTVKRPLHPYVSRGGLKLEKAIRTFELDMKEKIVLDIGASTGGFTDCALQHGAKKVYAVDVGYGQLAWKLRQDSRVIVLERTNFRYMKPEQLMEGRPDMATIDVSFISLAHIFPNLKRFLPDGGTVIALVKPQFEAGRQQVEKKGIVKDPHTHREVLMRVIELARASSFCLKGLTFSPILGSKGNIEFLAYFSQLQTSAERRDQIAQADSINSKMMSMIEDVIQNAHAAYDKPKQSNG